MSNRIELANTHDVKGIVQLLNEVTLDLQGKGINQWVYPYNVSEIEVDIKNGCVSKLIIGSKIIGTFSLRNLDSKNYPVQEGNSRYLYRIAILPKYQGKGIGLEIIDYVKKHSKILGLTIYLDCWAGNKKLIDFYTYAGFTFIGDFPEEDYVISIFKWYRL